MYGRPSAPCPTTQPVHAQANLAQQQAAYMGRGPYTVLKPAETHEACSLHKSESWRTYHQVLCTARSNPRTAHEESAPRTAADRHLQVRVVAHARMHRVLTHVHHTCRQHHALTYDSGPSSTGRSRGAGRTAGRSRGWSRRPPLCGGGSSRRCRWPHPPAVSVSVMVMVTVAATVTVSLLVWKLHTR